ncbi:glycoside hydrolase family protein [Listeria weihenstephanensis FSL R9-0317]|uniref:glycosyltransferase family 4 protein n=1 Tax=Listeria weihenstephanensis TaxID=1006155 RepID=UPI0003E86CB3|nr:glycosyltransferase family 4 protein [Listeria weihenstephanensis]EUJ40921.1 glycoside hydrolase family protein [Listeria weihenstephanensis FSL R9-0317]
MKKILLISQNFYPEIGSAANRMKQLFRLLGQKYDTTLYTTEPQYPNRDIYEQEKFWDAALNEEKIVRVKTRTSKYETKMIFRFLLYLETLCRFILKILRTKESFDVVYVSSPPISIALAGLVAKRKLKAKLIVDIRDLWPESLKGVGKFNSRIVLWIAYRLEKRIYKRADEIIVNSERFATYITDQGIDQNKITFVPNALTPEELELGSKKRPIMNEPITVIYTGNIGLAQELASFIRMADYFKDNAAVQFKMIGYGANYQKLIDTVKERELVNIMVSPPDTRCNVLMELAQADVAFVSLVPHPVFETVIPGKIVDYMGIGLPIIGMVSGYCKDIIYASNTGFIYGRDEEDAMYRGLSHLIKDHELRGRLRKKWPTVCKS